VVFFWIAAAVATVVYLPAPSSESGEGISDLVPSDAPAIQAEKASLQAFDVPVLARVLVVQRDPAGLSPEAQRRVVERAASLDASDVPIEQRPIPGAIPILNTLRLFPGSRESGTTAITYLLFRPDQSVADQVAEAGRYARGFNQPDDHLVGVTGPVPARQAQTDLIERWLPWVEAVTIALIIVILGLFFRAPGAPLLTLAAAFIAYIIALRAIDWFAERAGASVPQDVEPVVVALLLGVITDYSVFFLAGYRRRLEEGQERLDGARQTAGAVVPIVFTAGLIVAASSAALLAAQLGFLRAFGPALGLTVLVSLLVSITLVPAAMAIAGRWLFWPGRRSRAQAEAPAPQRDADGEASGAAETDESSSPQRRRLSWSLSAKPVAAAIAVVCLAALLAGAWGLRHARFGFPLISGLPSDNEVARSADAAEQGFAPGVLSPTEILLQGSDLDSKLTQLGTLQHSLEGVRGVAGVLGPELPPSVATIAAAARASGVAGQVGSGQGIAPPGGAEAVADAAKSIIVSDDGRAARLIVIMGADPLGPDAIDTLQRIEDAMPGMLARAGLAGIEPAYAGDTALAEEAIHQTYSDLLRVGIAAILISMVLLALFLRGLIAPLYLLATSVIALAASLGLTVFVFQDLLGLSGLTYYIPFAAAVLLVSLGSDYNIFVVGRIWDEARVRPLREAIAVAGPRAARTITVAGLVLAGSFAVLGLVPLVQFREFAFVMAVGILLDTFLVRSLLVPSLISVFGRVSWWPWRGPRLEAETEQSADEAAA
jgi:RND superfamily putative drug exporter